MPLVVVARNSLDVNDVLVEKLVKNLPEIVANALSVSGTDGALTSQEIEVWVQDFGPYDVNTKKVEIIIWANFYPERAITLHSRRAAICRAVREILPKRINGFVWVLLQPSSFGEF